MGLTHGIDDGICHGVDHGHRQGTRPDVGGPVILPVDLPNLPDPETPSSSGVPWGVIGWGGLALVAAGAAAAALLF